MLRLFTRNWNQSGSRMLRELKWFEIVILVKILLWLIRSYLICFSISYVWNIGGTYICERQKKGKERKGISLVCLKIPQAIKEKEFKIKLRFEVGQKLYLSSMGCMSGNVSFLSKGQKCISECIYSNWKCQSSFTNKCRKFVAWRIWLLFCANIIYNISQSHLGDWPRKW